MPKRKSSKDKEGGGKKRQRKEKPREMFSDDSESEEEETKLAINEGFAKSLYLREQEKVSELNPELSGFCWLTLKP